MALNLKGNVDSSSILTVEQFFIASEYGQARPGLPGPVLAARRSSAARIPGSPRAMRRFASRCSRHNFTASPTVEASNRSFPEAAQPRLSDGPVLTLSQYQIYSTLQARFYTWSESPCHGVLHQAFLSSTCAAVHSTARQADRQLQSMLPRRGHYSNNLGCPKRARSSAYAKHKTRSHSFRSDHGEPPRIREFAHSRRVDVAADPARSNGIAPSTPAKRLSGRSPPNPHVKSLAVRFGPVPLLT